MRVSTYIENIQREMVCSIQTCESLDKALHREGILPDGLTLRFRPLMRDFDVVSTAWFKQAGRNWSDPSANIWRQNPVKNPMCIVPMCQAAALEYSKYLAAGQVR